LQFIFPTRERQSSGLAVQTAELISSFSKFGTLYTVIGSGSSSRSLRRSRRVGEWSGSAKERSQGSPLICQVSSLDFAPQSSSTVVENRLSFYASRRVDVFPVSVELTSSLASPSAMLTGSKA
jgi:hypothetical protein